MSFLDFPGLQYFYNKYLKPIKPHAREETIKSYTVNEQGHVPDAQLVVQLKEENESLQEEIEKLNSALINKQDLLVKITPTESNFDELYTSGWYWINPTITNINAPVSEWGLLETYNTGGIMQRFTTYSVTQESKQYVRMYANSVWTLWSQL